MLSFLLIILVSSVFALPINTGGTGSAGYLAANTGPKVVLHTKNGYSDVAAHSLINTLETGVDGILPNIVAGPLLNRDNSRMRNVARDLEEIAQPVLQAAPPLADGVDQGATQLGAHAANAADAAGEAVNQAAAGAGDIAQGTLQGAAGTVGSLPGRADQLLQALDNNPGLLGELDRVLLGRASQIAGGQ